MHRLTKLCRTNFTHQLRRYVQPAIYDSLTDPPLFIIPDNYDFTKTSVEVYGSKDMNFLSREQSRSRIDYNFHSNFMSTRQELHDTIVDYTLGACTKTYHDPWIVFTAGAMGSGKTSTMKRLSHLDYFPINNFVRISPDRLKRLLPEFPGYLHYDQRTVGRKLRTEVGYIAEICLWESMFRQNCIWLDSSLRDANFHEKLFAQIRKDFPMYRIAVVHVRADSEKVFFRAQERTKATQRIVPPEDIQKSLDEVPKTMNILKPLCDFFTEIDNNYEKEDIKIIGHTWEGFVDVWKCEERQTQSLLL